MTAHHHPLDPIHQRHRALVACVLAQGVRDAQRGDVGAIEWLDGPDFDFWCNWVDIDPTAARHAVRSTLPTRRVRLYRRNRKNI